MATKTINATMQMRHGHEEDFDPDQMTAGEWGVSEDTKKVWMCFMPGLVYRMATYEAFEKDMEEIQQILKICQDIQSAVERFMEIAEQHSQEAEIYSKESQSWAVGGTGTRVGEDTDNAKYYSEQSKEYSESWRGYIVTQKEYDELVSSGQVKKDQPYYITDANNNLSEATDSTPGTVIVDSELFTTSENPVQNKIITKRLNEISSNVESAEIRQKSYTDTKIADLINGAPSTLDTLGEIADAMSEHQSVVQALDSAIGSKVDKISGKGLSENDYTTAEKNKLAEIPIVGNGTFTIQRNGTDVQTFSANQSSNATANIIVPTKTSELTNDSGFLTAESSISGVSGVKGNAESAYRSGNVNLTPENIGAVKATAWTAITKGVTWSRICSIRAENGYMGFRGILSVSATRFNISYGANFLISAGTLTNIIQLDGGYNNFRYRIVTQGSHDIMFEIYDSGAGITNTSTQSWRCSFIPFGNSQDGSITPYTEFIDGTTVPSGWNAGIDKTTEGRNTVVANKFFGELSGNASSSSRLNIDIVGSSLNPVFFKNGVPVECVEVLFEGDHYIKASEVRGSNVNEWYALVNTVFNCIEFLQRPYLNLKSAFKKIRLYCFYNSANVINHFTYELDMDKEVFYSESMTKIYEGSDYFRILTMEVSFSSADDEMGIYYTLRSRPYSNIASSSYVSNTFHIIRVEGVKR